MDFGLLWWVNICSAAGAMYNPGGGVGSGGENACVRAGVCGNAP